MRSSKDDTQIHEAFHIKKKKMRSSYEETKYCMENSRLFLIILFTLSIMYPYRIIPTHSLANKMA